MAQFIHGSYASNCQDQPLGMENGNIPNKSLTGTPSYHPPTGGRLNKMTVFCAQHGSYLQIDLGTLHKICAVGTQGYASQANEFVKTYKVDWSLNGQTWSEYKENDVTKVFDGNVNYQDVKKNPLSGVEARYIRIRPITWYINPCLRAELYGQKPPFPQDCQNQPLGMENGKIPDSRLSGTPLHPSYPPTGGRLNKMTVFCAQHGSYLQIDLGTLHKICAVGTQGYASQANDFVKTYKVDWSLNGQTWSEYKENGVTKVFGGNVNYQNVKKNPLSGVEARYIRISPITWYINPCFRAELYGQPPPFPQDCQDQPLGMENGNIPNKSLTGTPIYHPPTGGRLNKMTVFCAQLGSYLEIDLGTLHKICAVGTQGYASQANEFVKTYKVDWSLNGQTWFEYKENGVTKVFDGNVNYQDVKKNPLSGVKARYIRIRPITWYNNPCLRAELYGQPPPFPQGTFFASFGQDHGLSGHVIKTTVAKDAISCLWYCSKSDPQCKSFNYSHMTTSCELNSATKEESPGEFVKRDGFTYYAKVEVEIISF